MSRLARVQEVQKPAVRVAQDDLTRQIQNVRHDVSARRLNPIGKMLALFLGQDDEATWMKNAAVRDRIASLSKVRGLQLEWPQSIAPHISWTQDQSAIAFPFGCPKPPRIPDPRNNFSGMRPGLAPVAKKTIEQDITDYASGYIEGVGGEQFIVLQPVLYIGVWIMDGLYNLIAHPDPISGKYPTLLMHPRKDRSDAMIVFGRFELASARPGGEEMPWEQRAS